MKILIRNGIILTMKGPAPEIITGDLGIEDDKIVFVGTSTDKFVPEKTIDASGKIVLPGLVNAHTHIAMSLMRHQADDLPFWEWLNDRILPLEEKLTPDFVYTGSLLGIAEMIRSGVTTFADMYFYMDETARAVDVSGIRAHLSRGLVHTGKESFSKVDEAADFHGNWNGKAEDRIRIDLGPHAPYTCPPDFLEYVVKTGRELGCGFHTHISESKKEIETIMDLYGQSPVAYMENHGLFTQRTYAAHCVYVSDDDIHILKDNGVGVVNNPGSNFKLGNGFAPVGKLIDSGVNVALGTDGAASNNNLNLFEEIHLAALVNKAVDKDPTSIPAYEALGMATTGGAKVLGREDEIGTLEEGKKADVIMVDTNKPHFYPSGNPVSSLVYSAQGADVSFVMCNGRIIMEKGRILTLDEESILKTANKASLILKTGR